MRRVYLPLWFVVLLSAGCTPPAGVDQAALSRLAARAESEATIGKLIADIDGLSAKHVKEVEAFAAKRMREQEHQATARHWLIVAAVALLLGGTAALAGKLGLGAGAWWGALLSAVGAQVRWRTVAVGTAAGLACVALAIWIDPVWTYLRDLGWLAAGALALLACWELACRYYTGAWLKDDLVRLPAGWRVAPESKG
jgi:hypothetical protein